MAALRDIEFLRRELPRWVSDGLITAEQQERILARYAEDAPASPAASPRRVVSWIPAILIGLAVVLLGAGLLLFYAANWRKMSAGVKLAQVFGVLLLSYGGSYYFHFSKHRLELAGRGLMLLGMFAFGAAIGLVAQVFHISAHPADGVLLWLVATLSLSLVMQERWGYYLATILALVWNGWEWFVFDNPNYLFVFVPPLLFYGFHRKGDHVGMVTAGFALLLWFYQVNIQHLVPLGSGAAAAFLLLHVPLGVCLLALPHLLQAPRLRVVAGVFGATGWLFLLVPLIGLSWPMQLDGRFLLLQHPFLAVQHVLLLVTGTALVLFRRGRKEPVWLPALGLALGLALLLLPMGQKVVLLVVTHLGLLGLVMGLLYHSHAPDTGRTVDRVLAYLVAISTLMVKGLGLFIVAVAHRSYYVAYSLGFVVFATVMFLLALYTDDLLARRPSAVRLNLPGLCGLSGLSMFLMVYAVSFRVPAQETVLRADPVVLVLLLLFIALALLFYLLLWRRGVHRLPLVLSGVVFLVSVLILFVAGPQVSWEVYSIAFNVLLLVVVGVLIYYSTRVNSVLLLNLAIAGFGLQVTTRYFDIFWDLLSGSLLFIVTGIVLFGGGLLLEVNRRKVIQHIQREERQ